MDEHKGHEKSHLAAVEEIDAALADAFAPGLCAYCDMPCEGKWCSSQCRAADSYDGQHDEDR